MPKISGVSADEAVRALKKAGFGVLRQGKHVIMSNGIIRLTIPRHDPVNAYTMGAIAADAGFSPACEFPSALPPGLEEVILHGCQARLHAKLP